ncbi:hypothetical protein [Pseudomonas soli]|uniref:hypothetical protein n=1 Tax=Pseudomonas soli TaxID=1306993 RepID=UPI0028A95066|nr:hypothetical protein [Pseudomonas soli]
MKRALQELIEAGEPLMQQAFEALRRYHEAEAEGRPTEEIDRLELHAEYLFQAALDYQLRALGGFASILH